MKRNIKKQFWFNANEAKNLKTKAEKAYITEAALVRMLIKGYEPKEKPDDRFYAAMRELSAIGNNINQLATKANALGLVDVPMLKNEVLRWHRFQADIEAQFLRPSESNLKCNYVTLRIAFLFNFEIVVCAIVIEDTIISWIKEIRILVKFTLNKIRFFSNHRKRAVNILQTVFRWL